MKQTARDRKLTKLRQTRPCTWCSGKGTCPGLFEGNAHKCGRCKGRGIEPIAWKEFVAKHPQAKGGAA